MTFTYRIPIGDWSGDGHSQCDYFTIKSNKDGEALVKAYRTMADLSPDYDPTSFCAEYEDSVVPEHIKDKLKEIGEFNFYEYKGTEYVEFGPDEMIQYVLWWLKMGDPELELELIKNPPAIYLPDRRNNTSFIGYGLFF